MKGFPFPVSSDWEFPGSTKQTLICNCNKCQESLQYKYLKKKNFYPDEDEGPRK